MKHLIFRRYSQYFKERNNRIYNSQFMVHLRLVLIRFANTLLLVWVFPAETWLFLLSHFQPLQPALPMPLKCNIKFVQLIIVLLRCFDLDGSVGHESAFSVSIDDKRNIYWHSIFSNMPTCYVVAKISGAFIVLKNTTSKTVTFLSAWKSSSWGYNGLRTEGMSQFTVSRYDNVARVSAYRKWIRRSLWVLFFFYRFRSISPFVLIVRIGCTMFNPSIQATICMNACQEIFTVYLDV